MNNRKNWVLDSNGEQDIFELEKKIVERQNEDRNISKLISEKLKPIVDKIYADKLMDSPFKKYTSVV